MLTQDNTEKERLQLIGITALFIASKIEVKAKLENNFQTTSFVLFQKEE